MQTCHDWNASLKSLRETIEREVHESIIYLWALDTSVNEEFSMSSKKMGALRYDWRLWTAVISLSLI